MMELIGKLAGGGVNCRWCGKEITSGRIVYCDDKCAFSDAAEKVPRNSGCDSLGKRIGGVEGRKGGKRVGRGLLDCSIMGESGAL